MANSARERSTCAAGALSERLRRVSSWRSSAASGRRGSFWERDMGHLGARGSPRHDTRSHGSRPTRVLHPGLPAGAALIREVTMEVLHPRCAGLDVHRDSVVACVRLAEGRHVERHVETFATTTADLERLSAWLAGHGVAHVAMEATGVYWKPVWAVLC